MSDIFNTPAFQQQTETVGGTIELLEGIFYKVPSMNMLNSMFKDVGDDDTMSIDRAFKELLVDGNGNPFTNFQENNASEILTPNQVKMITEKLMPLIQAEDKKK